MSSLQLLCPNIDSNDFVSQFRSKVISSFITIHISVHIIFSAANLDVKQGSQDVCLYYKPSVIDIRWHARSMLREKKIWCVLKAGDNWCKPNIFFQCIFNIKIDNKLKFKLKFLGIRPYSVSPYDNQSTPASSSSFVQSDAVIYLKNVLTFNWQILPTFKPIGPTIIPHLRSLCTSSRNLSPLEKRPKMTPPTALS